MEVTALNINDLIQLITMLGIVWGGYKVIKEILDLNNVKHDQMQKWDGYDTQIAEVKSQISDLSLETNAKIQQVQAEQCMQTFVLEAVLDGLHQLNCNGKVTEASEKLHEHMNKQAHGVE